MCKHLSSRSTHLYFGVVEFFALDCSSHHYTIQHATHNSVLHCSTLQCNALYGNAFRSTGAHRVVSACTVLCMLLTFHTWLHASHLAGIPFPSCLPRLPLHCNAQSIHLYTVTWLHHLADHPSPSCLQHTVSTALQCNARYCTSQH